MATDIVTELRILRGIGGGDEVAVRAPGDPCNAMVVLLALTRP